MNKKTYNAPELQLKHLVTDTIMGTSDFVPLIDVDDNNVIKYNDNYIYNDDDDTWDLI